MAIRRPLWTVGSEAIEFTCLTDMLGELVVHQT
jgi:hypothetical protein